MSLAGSMMRDAFVNGTFTAAVFLGDTEVSPRGYRPVPFRNWEVRGTNAIGLVTFGPYSEPYQFDRYVLFAGDDVVQMIPEESVIGLPAGVPWPWQLEVELGQQPHVSRTDPKVIEHFALARAGDAARSETTMPRE